MSFTLKDCGISTIIAIDDVFIAVNEEDILGDYPKEIIETIDWLLGDDFQRYKEYSISRYVAETGDIDFLNKLNKEINNKHERYSWLMSDGIDFKPIGANVEAIKTAINNLSSEDRSRKHLVVLDRKLQGDIGGVENNTIFIEILKTVQSLIKEKNLLLLIYTDNEKPEELKSFEGTKAYLKSKFYLETKDAEELALHFNYVKKTEGGSVDFLDSVLKSQKANYIQEYKNIFNESYSKLIERLWELNKNQALFYYDYINEGQHADEILYNIFLTKFNQVYSKKFSEEAIYNALINPIRRTMQKKVSDVVSTGLNYRWLKEFDISLKSEDKLLWKPSSTEISFGDIIQIDNREFMVLSQDCDIAIREDFTRNLTNFHLVEIEKVIEDVTQVNLREGLKKLNKDHSKFIKDTLKKNGFIEKEVQEVINTQNPIVNIERIKELVTERKLDDNLIELCEKYQEIDNEPIINALRNYGIDASVVQLITDFQTPKSRLTETQIGDFKRFMGYKVKGKQIVYSISCYWLDALLIKKQNCDTIVFSKESLQNSHEIRYATKKYLEKELDNLLNWFKEQSEKSVNSTVKFIFKDLKIKCQAKFENETLLGFELKDIKRNGRLERLEAMKILQEVQAYSSRIPDSSSMLI
ncbi:hypothetical protein [Streptococcus suis]|uniref:hypothetical protein n=1 Tax=Streptococcus suis TaxID=1307 RepID=UPI000CF70866|nr:hypothetical protein [Streptococcus suis]